MHRYLKTRASLMLPLKRISEPCDEYYYTMPTAEASKFIEEAVNHPDWLKTIETAKPDAIVGLAKENGFDCSMEDLKQAAKDLLSGNDQQKEKAGHPNKQEVDEAAAGMSDFQNDTGYSNDTGYAVLYGVAGVILKM